MSTSPQPSAGRELSGLARLTEIERLLHVLEVDLKEKNLLPPLRNAILERLKPYTRSTEDSDPLFTEQGVNILCRHSFDGNSLITSRAALKCLANVMLLNAQTRQMFVDSGYAPKAAERLKNDNREDEFLASRLLFLSTYDTAIDFNYLFDDHQLGEGINTNLTRHAKRFAKNNPKNSAPEIDVMALSETLKLFFNLSQFYPDQVTVFTKSLLPILKILANVRLPSPPLQSPVTYLINSLLNLDLEDAQARHFIQNPIFPKFDAKCNVNRLIAILDGAVRHYTEEQLEQLANPLISLLRKIHDFAPLNIKSYMCALLLPSNDERTQPLGRSDSLSAYLLRLSTSAGAPNLRETISNMLFELSNRDATNFVRNVGYGFASGFLMTHDLPVPENALEAWSTDSEEREKTIEDPGEKVTNIDGFEINPITGQRKDMEPEIELEEMTDEEKEREAEKLFVLFERLKATGVVNVENPVIKAIQEGRLEELD